MSGPVGKVATPNSQNILNDWISVSTEKDAKAPGGVKITEKQVSAKDSFKLRTASFLSPVESFLKHPAPEKSTGTQGVPRLAQQAHPPREKGATGDMTTVQGARDTLMKYCENFRAQFMDQGGIREKLAAFKKQLAVLENDVKTAKDDGAREAAAKKLENALTQLAAFQEKCNQLTEARQALLAYFPKPHAGPERNLNVTDAYLDKKAMADLAEMRVAVRNFRYDYDKYNAGGKLGAKRTMGEFFSSTRNSFFRALAGTKLGMKARGDKDIRTGDEHRAVHAEQKIASGAFEWERMLAVEVHQMGEELAKTLGTGNRPSSIEDFGKASETERGKLGTGLLKLEEALRTKTGDAPLSMAGRDQLLKTLKDIGDPEKGGYKKLALMVTAGGVLPVDVAEVSLSAKYKYCLDIQSLPGGRISVKRVHSFGVKLDIQAGVSGAKVKGGAEAGLAAGEALEFDSYEEAAESLSSNGFQGVLNGLWTGGVGSAIKDIPLKWADRAFGQKNNYNEIGFLHYARENGFLDKADATLGKGANVHIASKQKVFRLGGGGKISGQVQLARMKGELSGDGYHGFNTLKTESRSFFTYLRSERKGEAADIYRNRVGSQTAPSVRTLEDREGVVSLLAETPEQLKALSPDERAERREAILAQLDDIVDSVIRTSDSVSDVLEGGRDLTKAKYREIAQMFPQATAAAQALIDRLEILSEGMSSEEKAHAKETVKLVERALSNPPIKFPKDVFESEFGVQRTFHTGGGHVEGEFRFSYDLATLLNAKFLTEGFLSSTGTYGTGTAGEKIALGARRAAASGVSNVLTNLTGAASSVSVHVTHDSPKTDDPRPWSNHKTTTLDIRMQDNMPTKAIYAVIMNAVTRTLSDKESGCAEAGISASNIGLTELGKFLSGALVRGFYDLTGGAKADQSIQDGVSIFAESILSDYVWEGLKNIRLSFEDGQLASVSFGNAETMRIEARVKAGFVQVSGGFDYESLVNTRTMLNRPTFDTLTGYCDAFQRSGKQAEWKHFMVTNRAPFLRMFNALAGKDDSKQGLNSLSELLNLQRRIRDDIKTADPAMKRRLTKCQKELDAALSKLRLDSQKALPEKGTEARAVALGKRILDVSRVLKAAARYYDVSDDRRQEGIESLNPVSRPLATKSEGDYEMIFYP